MEGIEEAINTIEDIPAEYKKWADFFEAADESGVLETVRDDKEFRQHTIAAYPVDTILYGQAFHTMDHVLGSEVKYEGVGPTEISLIRRKGLSPLITISNPYTPLMGRLGAKTDLHLFLEANSTIENSSLVLDKSSSIKPIPQDIEQIDNLIRFGSFARANQLVKFLDQKFQYAEFYNTWKEKKSAWTGYYRITLVSPPIRNCSVYGFKRLEIRFWDKF